MKLWTGHGSEHSMNLVMIGRFKDAGDAEAAKALIDRMTALVLSEQKAGRLEVGQPIGRYPDGLLDALAKENFVTVGAGELEQFLYDVAVEQAGDQVEVRTDESDVSAFLKAMIHHGARVEVFSAHDHPPADSP